MKICETGRTRVVARIGGSTGALVQLEFQAHSSVKGRVEDELEDSNGRYAARIMRCACDSLGNVSRTRLEAPFGALHVCFRPLNSLGKARRLATDVSA